MWNVVIGYVASHKSGDSYLFSEGRVDTGQCKKHYRLNKTWSEYNELSRRRNALCWAGKILDFNLTWRCLACIHKQCNAMQCCEGACVHSNKLNFVWISKSHFMHSIYQKIYMGFAQKLGLFYDFLLCFLVSLVLNLNEENDQWFRISWRKFIQGFK